jgi:hypothetical protein
MFLGVGLEKPLAFERLVSAAGGIARSLDNPWASTATLRP